MLLNSCWVVLLLVGFLNVDAWEQQMWDMLTRMCKICEELRSALETDVESIRGWVF